MRSAQGIDPICVVDDDPGRTGDVLGAPVIGGRDYLAPLRAAGLRYAVNAVGAIGRIQDRIAIFELLDELGFELPTLVDPAAFVAESATLAEGAQVFAGALVCSAATVGKGTIVNSGAIVSHDCRVGSYSHLAPGAVLAGEVEVGDAVLVGMGVTARVGLRIGSGASSATAACCARTCRPARSSPRARSGRVHAAWARRQRRVRSMVAAVNSTGWSSSTCGLRTRTRTRETSKLASSASAMAAASASIRL